MADFEKGNNIIRFAEQKDQRSFRMAEDELEDERLGSQRRVRVLRKKGVESNPEEHQLLRFLSWTEK